jgi:glycosyltransferase involved in cell wall biosynthesis
MWQRTINQWLVGRAVNRALGVRMPNEYRVVLTTLPITADLQAVIDADHWVYYRVDDFSSWPGVDNAVMANMESQLIASVDYVVAASDVLGMLPGGDRAAGVVTHGVDLAHWSKWSGLPLPVWWQSLSRPIFLFWGLIDTRLDVAWCARLKQALGSEGSIVLLGPRAASAPALPPGIVTPGPQLYADLPRFAQSADVLLLPYAATAFTQTIQPLKLKEYLATGKPVVGRTLPAIREWADAADLVERTDDFVARAVMRARTGISVDQLHARGRLSCESWRSKAERLEAFLGPG